MLAVLAARALTGFGYPATAGPVAFNVLAKILAFGAALNLVRPQPDEGNARHPARIRPVRGQLTGIS